MHTESFRGNNFSLHGDFPDYLTPNKLPTECHLAINRFNCIIKIGLGLGQGTLK